MQFLYPAFLWAALTALIPIIIHLFNFRRYKTVYFSNVRFMQSVRKEAKSRSQLRNLLLLILRILAILFLVIAFAQPVKIKDKKNVIKSRQIVSLYIDNSFSMDAEGKFGVLIEQAKAKAHEIVSSYDLNTRFLLTTNNFELKHQQLVDKDQAIDWVGEIKPTHIIRNYKEVIQRQQQVLKSIDTTIQITQYFLSDFQRSVFDSTYYPANYKTNLVLVPLINENKQNVYIDSAWFSTPGHFIDKKEELNVKLVNTSNNEVNDFRINLFINDSLKALSTVTLEAEKSTIFSLSFIQNKIGENKARIEITDYPITFDNTLYFSYFIDKNIKVLCINGKDGKAFFPALLANDANFAFTNRSYKEVDYEEINQQQLVILNQLDEISSGLALTLKEFVSTGNRLLIIPTVQSADQYNSLLQQLGCSPYIEWKNEQGNCKPINLQQLYFKDAVKELNENSLMPEYKGYYSLRKQNLSLAEVILESESGHPLVLQNKFNQGSVIVFTIPLSQDNNLAYHPIFIPLVYNISLYSSRLDQLYYTINPGLIAQTKTEQNSGVYKLVPDNNSPEFLPLTQHANGILKVFVDENELSDGTFHLYRNNDPLTMFSFNYNRQESDLDCYTLDELSAYAQNAPEKNIDIINSQKQSIASELQEAKSGKPLSYIFVVFSLIMLLGEFVLIKLWH